MSYVVSEDEKPEEDYNTWHQKGFRQDFSSIPVVETLPSNAGVVFLIPGCRAKMLQSCSTAIKQKEKKKNSGKSKDGRVREHSMHR